MQDRNLEALLAEHCAPTLLSRKCASLVALSRDRFPRISSVYRDLQELRKVGIESRIFCFCKERILLFLYRPDALADALSDQRAGHILAAFDYPLQQDLPAMLNRLSERLRTERSGFPHEIGLFLGYPPEDVESFIINKGAGCKLCGCWKVYHNIPAAKEAFACYENCRAYLKGGIEKGVPILKLLSAA